MTKTSYLVWPAVLLTSFGLMASCGGNGGSSSGDGDGDMGGDAGDGDGDGDNSGGSAMGGGGGEGGANGCPEECPNDGNPCTEDVCNPDTGQCGVPRTGNACDDGIYCNGEDTCDSGECSEHAGDPCTETSCNEGKKACECSQVEHCPGQDLSDHKYGSAEDWGTVSVGEECTYDDEYCDENCSCSVQKVTYTCEAGSCKAKENNFVDPDCEVRETDGDSCPDDANDCNGVEKCKAGSCVPDAKTAPVCGGDTPQCRDGNMTHTCVECTQNAHCGDAAPYCCSNKCQDTKCVSIPKNITIQNLKQNIVLQNFKVQP